MGRASSKFCIFLVLPTLFGMIGLYAAYLKQIKDPDRKMTIEADFGLPFMLTLLLVLVIGFQTNGYSSSQMKPLVSWPKVKKKRKVTHKHVVKCENIFDGNQTKKED